MGNDGQKWPHVFRRTLKTVNTSNSRKRSGGRVRSGQAGNGCRSLNGELYSPTCRLRRALTFPLHCQRPRCSPRAAYTVSLVERCRARRGPTPSSRPPSLRPLLPGLRPLLPHHNAPSPGMPPRHNLVRPFSLLLDSFSSSNTSFPPFSTLFSSFSSLVRDRGDWHDRPRKDRHWCRR